MLNSGAAVAVLDNATVLGLPLASCVIDSVADLLPAVVGANVTVSVHVLFAVIALLHPETVKSDAFAPEIAKLATVKGPVPVLVTVIVPDLVALTSVDAIDRLLVLKLMAGAVAVPLNVTALGLPLASCVIDSVADLLPVVAGANVTVSVHVPPAATELLQPVTVKSEAFVPEIAKLETVSGAVPVLVTVIVPVLVLFMLVLVTDNELVLRLIAGASAVLLTLTLLGLPAALCEIASVADLLPLEVGVNVTPMVHVSFTATLLEHPVALNSAALAPENARFVTVNGAVPIFVTVILLVVLDPTVAFATVNVLELRLIIGAGARAVLDRLTVLGLPLALCVIDSVADLPPEVVGANVTVNVQVSPAATELLQPETVKSAASVPVIAKLATVRGAVPVFVTIIVPVFDDPVVVDVTDNELVLRLMAGAVAVDVSAMVVVAAL